MLPKIVNVPDMVNTSHGSIGVWWMFESSPKVITRFINARKATNTKDNFASFIYDINYSTMSKIIHIGTQPATKWQFLGNVIGNE